MITKLNFGVHAGKTLVELVVADSSYFWLALRAGVFRDHGGSQLEREARLAWQKARHIRLPQHYPDGSSVAHQLRDGQYEGAMTVTFAEYDGGAELKGYLDLGCGVSIEDIGNKQRSRDFMRIVFGIETGVTISQLEEFFANPDNFDLPGDTRQAAE